MAGSFDKVQVKYEELEAIAQKFAEMADKTRDSHTRLLRQMEVLRSGAWIGAGASRFFDEMDGQILPVVNKLENALSQTSGALRKGAEMFRDAEQQTGNLFKAQSGGLSAGGAGAGASPGVGGSSGGGGSSSFGGATAGGSASGKTGGLSDYAYLKGAAKVAAKKLIRNPTLISNLARLFSGGNSAGAVDDLVSLGRKLNLEKGLASGARVVAAGAGGVIDFAFLPPDQQNAETFGVQLTSGLIQGAITLNPIGAGVMLGNTVVQIGTSALAVGAEKFGEVFDVNTTGFVDGVKTVKETLNLDKHIDTVVQGVVDGAQSLIDRIF